MALVPTELSLPRLKDDTGTVPWAKRLVEELFIRLHDMGVAINAVVASGVVTVRKNTGADVGTRPRLNFIEGGATTLTVTDDGVDNEIDITITTTGGYETEPYLTIAATANLTAERVLVPAAGELTLVDGGPNANADLGLANAGPGATGPLGGATVTPIVTIDAKGRVTALSSVTIAGVAPGGAAGGDLTGTYPNPTIADADLIALRDLVATAGMLSRSGAGGFIARTLTAPAAGLTIADPTGAAGDPTWALANDLAALEALAGTGFANRTGADTWTVAALVDADIPALLSANARLAVRKNTGATVGTRRRVNLIEGSNITLTVADDAVDEEVDVTIASSGGAAAFTFDGGTNTATLFDFGVVNTGGVSDVSFDGGAP